MRKEKFYEYRFNYLIYLFIKRNLNYTVLEEEK